MRDRLNMIGPGGQRKSMYPIDARAALAAGDWELSDTQESPREQLMGRNTIAAARQDAAITRIRQEAITAELGGNLDLDGMQDLVDASVPDLRKCKDMDQAQIFEYAAQFGIHLDKRMKPNNMIADFASKLADRPADVAKKEVTNVLQTPQA